MVLFFLAGCGSGPPRLDTSSDASTASSMKKVRAALDATEQAKFDKALESLYMSGALDAMAGGKDPVEILANIHAKMDGKTAGEILEMAEGVDGEQ